MFMVQRRSHGRATPQLVALLDAEDRRRELSGPIVPVLHLAAALAELFARFQIGFYADPTIAVFTAIGSNDYHHPAVSWPVTQEPDFHA